MGWAGCSSITSDDHAGLRAARLAVFGGIPWQRCQFHLQQNAQAYVPHKDMQAEVADDIRTIFNAPDRATADAYLIVRRDWYQPDVIMFDNNGEIKYIIEVENDPVRKALVGASILANHSLVNLNRRRSRG